MVAGLQVARTRFVPPLRIDAPAMTSTPQPDPSATPDVDVEQQLAAELSAADADALMEASVQPEPKPAPASGEAAGAAEGADPASLPVAPNDAPEFHYELRRGRIAALRGEDVFVDLVGDFDGKKLQGVAPLSQFDRPPRLKSVMDFIVDHVDESQGLVFLSREGAISRSTWDQLAVGAITDARVTGANKGGLELELVGSIKAFMPASQIDIHHVDDLEALVGQKIQAAVQEIDRKHKKVLLSRRKYLEHKRERDKKKVLAEIEIGQEREGVVSNVTDFGAFIDLGGVDGLVHVTDMAHGHIDHPKDMVKPGDKVNVKVLKIDSGKGRISLGMKQILPDPWEHVPEKYRAGEEVSVRVTKTTSFGAFVEIEPGIEGLLPMSEMSWKRIHRAEDVVKTGDMIKVKVLDIQPGKHRFTVSIKASTGDPWAEAGGKFAVDTEVEGKVTSVTDFGAFVELEPGVEGLVHISELADRRVGQVSDIVNVGDVKTFRVKGMDATNHKISLSLRSKSSSDERGGRGEAPPAVKSKPRIPKGDLKSGLGKSGALGTGLGGLRLEDFK